MSTCARPRLSEGGRNTPRHDATTLARRVGGSGSGAPGCRSEAICHVRERRLPTLRFDRGEPSSALPHDRRWFAERRTVCVAWRVAWNDSRKPGGRAGHRSLRDPADVYRKALKMVPRTLIASAFLSLVIALAIACDPHSELPPTIPSGVGKALSSGAQGDPPVPKPEGSPRPEPKPPITPPTPKDSK